MEHATHNDTRRGTNLKREWQRHLKAWRAIGETEVSYCQQNGLSHHAFQYWKKNLEGNGSKRFVELSRSSLSGSGSVVEILIDNRVQMGVPHGVNAEHLQTVLQTVKEL